MPSFVARVATPAPGLAVALVVAATATFLSEHYDAPVMLYALLLGMALNFVTEAPRGKAGIDFAAKGLMRIGVALLGFRIGWDQVSALGWGPVVMVVTLVAATILISTLAARAMGFNPLFGFLSGGATAICGASAAMALSAALPPNDRKEQATLFTVIGVSALSTTAMVLYPLITRALGFGDHAAGVFIGATIHDVAQVVGAGYAISPDAGDTATIVKLLRVAMLLPVILVAGQISRRQAGAGGGERPAAALVRRRLHGAGCAEQPRRPAVDGHRRRKHAVALVPRHRDRRNRDEDAPRRSGAGRLEARRTDDRRDDPARRAGARLARDGGLMARIAKNLS